jgi:hypothetical protein
MHPNIDPGKSNKGGHYYKYDRPPPVEITEKQGKRRNIAGMGRWKSIFATAIDQQAEIVIKMAWPVPSNQWFD